MKNSNKKLIGTSILTAIASSLCCITPVLALIAGSSGLASSFSWLEPARPYLIGFTALALGFAWYQKRPKKKDEISCECESEEKPSFLQSRKFLGIVTVFAIVMTAFPYYSQAFYPDTAQKTLTINKKYEKNIDILISGMSCTGCEATIKYYVKKLPGVVKVNSDYKTGKANIEYDSSKTKYSDIVKAINNTGYKIIKNNSSK